MVGREGKGGGWGASCSWVFVSHTSLLFRHVTTESIKSQGCVLSPHHFICGLPAKVECLSCGSLSSPLGEPQQPYQGSSLIKVSCLAPVGPSLSPSEEAAARAV